MSPRIWAAGLALLLSACSEGGDSQAQQDAGPEADASLPDAGDAMPDGGPAMPDAGDEPGPLPPLPDVGRCDLKDAERPAPPDDALDPAGYPPVRGPGGPSTELAGVEMLSACAYLDGGERDRDHHNIVGIVDGYLVMPWAHEAGVGGVTLWDFSDPCTPVTVGSAAEDEMRETHAATFARIDGVYWMVTASMKGIMLWELSDPAAPRMAFDLELPGVSYPNAYRRVVMSTNWQAPYIYIGAADNGIFVVDASNPEQPEIAAQYDSVPKFRVGGVQALGNLLYVTGTEGSRANVLDISDPLDPAPIPGGSWLIESTAGGLFPGVDRLTASAYFAAFSGGYLWFAQTIAFGGLVIYDVREPRRPTFTSHYIAEPGATGAYVFRHENLAFVGLSKWGEMLDVSDVSQPQLVSRIEMTGDLDTITPVGNVIVVSVDDDAVPDQASEVQPYAAQPDSNSPTVAYAWPQDGAEGLSLGSRIGVSFNEAVELATAWRGSFILREAGGTALEGWYSAQDTVVNFTPSAPLKAGTRYEIVIPAGGITDVSGNAIAETWQSSFTTAPCE